MQTRGDRQKTHEASQRSTFNDAGRPSPQHAKGETKKLYLVVKNRLPCVDFRQTVKET